MFCKGCGVGQIKWPEFLLGGKREQEIQQTSGSLKFVESVIIITEPWEEDQQITNNDPGQDSAADPRAKMWCCTEGDGWDERGSSETEKHFGESDAEP